MNSCAAWRAPYDIHAARATFIDAWPVAWVERAPEMRLLALTTAECQALGAQIGGLEHWFAPLPAQHLQRLIRWLDTAIAELGGRCCVRLSSRSPKDSLQAQRHGLCVGGAAQALAQIVTGSLRCAVDLRMALMFDVPLALVVRRWLDFPDWAELRCFVQDGVWCGASQALYADGACFAELERHAEALLGACATLLPALIAAAPPAARAFDVACLPTPAGSWRAVLLDANPLGATTDLALYASRGDFDACLRWRSAAGISRLRLPALACRGVAA